MIMKIHSATSPAKSALTIILISSCKFAKCLNNLKSAIARMRWCILPAHTHYKYDSIFTNKTQNPRIRACLSARTAAVKLVFSPRNKYIQCTTVTETNANRTPQPPYKMNGACPASRRGVARPD